MPIHQNEACVYHAGSENEHYAESPLAGSV